MAKHQKTEYFGVRITKAQAKAVRRLARQSGKGVSTWVRETFENRIIALGDSPARNKESEKGVK